MQNIRWLSIVTTLILLSGCAVIGKHPEPSQKLTSQALDLRQGKTVDQPIQITWWKIWHDPLLNDLLERTLKRSPDIQLALKRIQAADVQALATLSQAGPKIGIGISQNRQKYPSVGYGLLPPPIAGSTMNTDTAVIKGDWQLDIWGQHWHEFQAALGVRCAASLEVKQAQLILSQAVISYYIKWQTISEQQRLLQQRIRNTQNIINLVTKRIKVGIQAVDSLYPLEQALASMRINLIKLENENLAIRHALATLSVQPINALDNESPKQWNSVPKIHTNGIKADILTQRPDVAAQYQMITAKNQMIKAAKTLFLPSIHIEGMAGFSALKASDLFNPLGKIFSFIPTVSMPIFRSGELMANLKTNYIQYDTAVIQYNKTLINAIKQVADSLDSYHNNRKIYQATDQLVLATQKQANAIKKRVNAGLDNQLSWLKLNDDVLARKMQLVSSNSALKLAYSMLNTSLGGGFNTADITNICHNPHTTKVKQPASSKKENKPSRLPEKTIYFNQPTK